MADPPEGLRAALSDRYIIDREIGHGGTATVYLAHDAKNSRPVAIKVLAPELALAVGTERFLREIQIAARLQHPNIVPLHDSEQTAGFLYYVMPFVEGESLRSRLEREGELPVEDALQIARGVASALSYAHSRDVVHRDIKPENILLSGGEAVVADFGIARAITAAGGDRLTATGIAVGTPLYMSPEQAAGSRQIDGRSDIYSLGCVVYEMLAGHPPFMGATPREVLARHNLDPVPPLRTSRATVSVAVEAAVMRALAKVPADRFATASQFIEALEAKVVPGAKPPWTVAAGIASGLVVALIVAWVALRAPFGQGAASAASVDTLHYAVLPFVYERGVSTRLNADQLLLDALGRWHGITLADPFRVKEALGNRTAADLTSGDARVLAVTLGSGRFARGEVTRVGDSIRVHVGSYDVATGGSLLRDGMVKVAVSDPHPATAFARLADRLLFAEDTSSAPLESRPGTTSLPARQLFNRGVGAVGAWQLRTADSAFGGAAAYDGRFAAALLWQAQVRFWSGDPIATWGSAAERAAAGRDQLSSRDRTLSDAIVAFARGDVVQACATWERATREERYDFAGWYGAATCLTRDSLVVRDAASPSGWRFRTSYHHALRAYERAFRLNPAIHTSFRAQGYRSLRRLLMTDGDAVRWGRAAPPDTGRFGAEPAWRNDSIALVPYRFAALSRGHGTSGREKDAAAMRERQLLHDIAVSWVSAFPTSGDALESLAISLELLGDPAALDTLERARALTREPSERLHIAASEVWLRLKLSLPSDVAGLRAACALADSLLALPPSERRTEAWSLAAIAALRGRVGLAVSLAREPQSAAVLEVPPPLARDASALLAFAALGGPADSLSALEQRVEMTIQNSLAPDTRGEARLMWLGRPGTLAFPDYEFRSLTDLAHQGDYLIDAQAAYLARDTATVRRIFADIADYRRTRRPADLTFDGLFPEASILAALGDRRGAVAWIDPTLNALRATAPGILADFTRSAALVRTMMLRAELGRALGDNATAKRWAKAVVILWDGADELLQPAVERMKAIAT